MATAYTHQNLNDKLAQASFGAWLDAAASLEDYLAYCKEEYEAESKAEGAWLRHAESQGWEEALQESYYESGLLARPW